MNLAKYPSIDIQIGNGHNLVGKVPQLIELRFGSHIPWGWPWGMLGRVYNGPLGVLKFAKALIVQI